MTKMRGHIARRSCSTHGDNGCEMQDEAGCISREAEKRHAKSEIESDLLDWQMKAGLLTRIEVDVPTPKVLSREDLDQDQ